MNKLTEEELALIIINHYKELGYEVYKEVHNTVNGSNRADIVLVKDNIFTVIETKLNFGLTVIKQCFKWKLNSNFTYVCCPAPKKRNSRRFGYDVCEDYGIGVIEYTSKGEIKVIKESTLNPNPILPQLYEQQKTQIAGGKNSEFITPFKITCMNIKEYLLESDDNMCSLNKIIDNIEHHYSSKYSARNSIMKMVKMGIIKDVIHIKDKKVNCLKIISS